jgi:spore germination protein KC
MSVYAERKPTITVQMKPEGVYIHVTLYLAGNILGNASLIDYALPKNRKVLEQAFSNHLKKECEALVKRTQNEFKSDIFGFGLTARKLALTQEQWHKMDWENRYPEAHVDINVKYKIRRTGLLYRITPPAIPGKGDREGEY